MKKQIIFSNSGDKPNIQEGEMIERGYSVFRVWQLYKNLPADLK